MINEHDDDNEHEHDEIDPGELAEALELDSRTQIFLEMRGQNLELLKIATQVAGYGQEHPPLKPDDLRKALRSIWDVYAEFYQWVDPEESEEDAEEDED